MSRAPRQLAGAGACTVLHVDLDAFYAAVELRDRPDLRGRPVIVGGDSRGVVLSATCEARRHGVHAAMPMTRARRLCPAAEVLRPRFSLYTRVSAGVMEIFRSVTPVVEPLSLDEAFIDIGGSVRRLGPPGNIAAALRDRVADEQGITCSVGAAATPFVAKLASTRCKPDGLLLVPPRSVVSFLHPLPVGELWGVGERTEEQLLRLGLRTVGDLAQVPEATLCRALGPGLGARLAALAWGRDERRVVGTEPERSVGAQQTFPYDVDDPAHVHRELLRLAERTTARMRAAGTEGRTVVLTVRFADFATITRSRTLPDATDVGQEVYATARGLFDALGLQRARLRLVGVRVERLAPAGTRPRQLALDDREHGRREAEQAVDRAVRRFGWGVVRPATLVGPPDRSGTTARDQRDRRRGSSVPGSESGGRVSRARSRAYA